MSVSIPESHVELLNGPLVVTLATVMPDGQPQLSVIWCTYDGTHAVFSTVVGRQKEKNMRSNLQVTLLAVDTTNPFRYLEVRGQVAEITREGATEAVNELCMIYTGVPNYYGGIVAAELKEQEDRVVCKILPTHVVARG